MIAGQILVALKSRDRMQEILPIIEKIAKPDKMGVQVSLALRGCFGQTLREYVLSESFQFVLMTAVTGQTMLGMLGLVRLAATLLGRIKRANFPSFPLYRSAALTEEDRFAAVSTRAQKPLSWLEENDSRRPGEA
jgi:hypothetical protein